MTTPCIPAQNAPNSSGYSMRRIDGVRKYEHVIAWEAVNGPVPEGGVLDHLCHEPTVCRLGVDCPHRRCINPEHLRLTTRGDNARRGFRHQSAKTHCPHNHPYSATNTYTDPRGRRHCRTCARRHLQEHKARKREERERVSGM